MVCLLLDDGDDSDGNIHMSQDLYVILLMIIIIIIISKYI